MVAVDVVARTCRLHDLERLQVVADRPDVVAEVRAPFVGYGHDAEVDDLEHLAGAGVEECDDAFDRPRVPVVGCVAAEVGDAAADAAPFFVRDPERSRGPRIDLDAIEVVDAPASERGLPVGVLLHADDGRERLAEQERGPHTRFDHPRPHLAVRDGDDHLERLEPRAGGHEQRLHLAVDGSARIVRQHDRLVGLV